MPVPALSRAPKDEATHDKRLRALPLEERGALLAAACRAAAKILEGRRASGLPEASPDPWPESTRDFMRRHATRASA